MITKEKWQEFVDHKNKLKETKNENYYVFLDIMDQCKEHGIAPLGPSISRDRSSRAREKKQCS